MQGLKVFCELPFNKIKVNPWGEVTMCCYQDGTLGNLLTQDFHEIWWSRLARDVRESTAAGRLHARCEGWGGCPYLVKPKRRQSFVVGDGYPTSLEFDLPNTHCNIGGTSPTPETACFMCPRSSPSFEAEPDHTDELTDRLKFLLPYLTELRIQGTAEPFWKDRVFEILERLEFRKYNGKCVFSTYTNGSILTAKHRKRLIEICPRAALFFSVDAATQETYQRIRRLNLFELVVENIRNFVKERGPHQRVDVANNMNLLNLHEAVQMVELGCDLKVDLVQFNPTHGGGQERADFQDVRVGAENYELFAEAQRKITARASELGVPVVFIRPLDLGFSSARAAVAASRPPIVPFPATGVAPRSAPPVIPSKLTTRLTVVNR